MLLFSMYYTFKSAGTGVSAETGSPGLQASSCWCSGEKPLVLAQTLPGVFLSLVAAGLSWLLTESAQGLIEVPAAAHILTGRHLTGSGISAP